MRLTLEQEAGLRGRDGASTQLAMRMLLAVGRAMRAEDLIAVSSAHIVLDAFAMGQPGTDLIASFRQEGARFVVPTSINAISFDRRGAPDAAVSRYDGYQRRMLEDCEAMGALSTCSCNPFNQGITPIFGEHVAWSESAATGYVNSVIGAHTNREGATAIASALTGLTPRYGMHLREVRRATVHFAVECILSDEADYNVLGSLIAGRAGSRIPVLSGLVSPSMDELFGFSASFAIVANIPMFHIVGITPEATSLEAVAQAGIPPPVPIRQCDLESERARYDADMEAAINLVTVGSPHASFRQIREVADLLDGRSVKSDVEFTLTTNRSNFALADSSGVLERLTTAGVIVTADKMCFGCDLGARKFDQRAVLATNSVKAAQSAPGTRGVKVRYGTIAQCVDAAVTGHWRGRE